MSVEDEIARAVLDSFDEELGEPEAVRLANGGPYILPRLAGKPGILIQDEDTAVIFLETQEGQQVRIPIDGDSLPAMARLIRYVMKVSNRGETDEP